MTLRASTERDEGLAREAQQGDHVAFDLLVGRHKELLYRLIRRYLGNSDDAYDVLQDTFIAVWETLHRFDPTRSFVAWTRTIALNKCRDFSRQRRRRQWLSKMFATEPLPEPLSPAQVADWAELETEHQHRLQRLSAAIAALPARYKEPLLLTAVSGLSQKEAAAALVISTKAVETRLRRARRRLATSFDPSSKGQAQPVHDNKGRRDES